MLSLLAGCQPSPPAPPLTGIAGRITDSKGEAVPGAWVYAYRNARGGLRGPADFAAQTDGSGDYFLDLVEGEYHLVARERRTGEAGPLRPGDAWALFPGNPVKVQAGRTAAVDLRLQTQSPRRKGGTLTAGDTGFTGRLVDASGRPVAGAFLLAYRNLDLHRMPDATAPAAGEDGSFILYLPEAGRWCLVARTGSRGQLQTGELFGQLGAGEAGCIQAMAGRILPLGEIVLHPYRR